MKLTAKQVKADQELAAKATPGPWSLDPHYGCYVWGPQSQMVVDDGGDEEGTLVRMRGIGANLPLKQNGEFISRARTALPDYAEALQEATLARIRLHFRACGESYARCQKCVDARELRAFFSSEMGGGAG